MSKSLMKLRAALKEIMKAQKLSQIELSEHLGISIATTRRIFSGEDISLNRLMEVCDWLEITIEELFQYSNTILEKSEVYYSLEQEEFLASNFHLLDLLGHLYDGKTIEEVCEEYSISSKNRKKYLASLEKYNLIYYTSRNKIRPLPAKQPRWRENGQISKYHSHAMFNGFSDYFLKKIKKGELSNKQLSIGVISLTEESYQKYLQEHDTLKRKIISESEIEKKIYSEEKLGKYIYMGGITWVSNESPERADIRQILNNLNSLNKK